MRNFEVREIQTADHSTYLDHLPNELFLKIEQYVRILIPKIPPTGGGLDTKNNSAHAPILNVICSGGSQTLVVDCWIRCIPASCWAEGRRCSPELLNDFGMRSSRWLHATPRWRSSRHRRGSTAHGSEDRSCLRCPRSNKCGSVRSSTTRSASCLYTPTASSLHLGFVWWCCLKIVV